MGMRNRGAIEGSGEDSGKKEAYFFSGEEGERLIETSGERNRGMRLNTGWLRGEARPKAQAPTKGTLIPVRKQTGLYRFNVK